MFKHKSISSLACFRRARTLRPPVINAASRWFTSVRRPPLSTGYVAGLQSYGPDAPFPDFEEAYSLLQSVDPAVLRDFENEMWETDRKKFVWGTKKVSVIDSANNGDLTTVTRSLLLNQRPNLIQSSVEIPSVGADGPSTFGAPPPLEGPTGTHLGGLALSLPLWLTGHQEGPPPQCAIIGAGGCTVPAVMARSGAIVTAVDPEEDVLEAARACFGAGDGRFEMVLGCGIEFLEGLRQRNGERLDVLIIDAEDGTAPPEDMARGHFWTDVVAPVLQPSAVVAVNCIGDEMEKTALKEVMKDALPMHSVWNCAVPSKAMITDRHTILFAVPPDCHLDLLNKILGSGSYVADDRLWLDMIMKAAGATL